MSFNCLGRNFDQSEFIYSSNATRTGWLRVRREVCAIQSLPTSFSLKLISPRACASRCLAETLRKIAREQVATVRRTVTIDWSVCENVRAQLRVVVKRILRKYGYPFDKHEKATQTVLEQAEVLSEGWALA